MGLSGKLLLDLHRGRFWRHSDFRELALRRHRVVGGGLIRLHGGRVFLHQ